MVRMPALTLLKIEYNLTKFILCIYYYTHVHTQTHAHMHARDTRVLTHTHILLIDDYILSLHLYLSIYLSTSLGRYVYKHNNTSDMHLNRPALNWCGAYIFFVFVYLRLSCFVVKDY